VIEKVNWYYIGMFAAVSLAWWLFCAAPIAKPKVVRAFSAIYASKTP
jgi:hypothetical protein